MADENRPDEALASALAAGLIAEDRPALTAHFDAIGATLPDFIWSPGSDALTEEALRVLLAYWLQLPQGPRARLAGRIDPRALKAALGFVMLLDNLGDGRDFRYRLYGSAIAARSGRDFTGMTVSELPLAPLTAFFLASYRACARRAEPLFIRHAPPVQVHVVSWDRLILPLDDGVGGIGRLLVGNVPGLRRS